MERLEFVEHVLEYVGLGQDGCPEMICAFSLPKTTAWYDANTGAFQKLERVEHIRFLAILICFFNCLRWDFETGESVHCTLHWVATESFESIEGVDNHFCSQLKKIQFSHNHIETTVLIIFMICIAVYLE